MTEFLVFKRQIILGFKRDIWSVFGVLLRQILEMKEGGYSIRLISYFVSKHLRIALMVKSIAVTPSAPQRKPAKHNSFSGTTYVLSIRSNLSSM